MRDESSKYGTELPSDIVEWQRLQYGHDLRNHFDVLSLHKADRLKHYGLHYAKYVGRIARGRIEAKTGVETLVDTFLVCLSAANTLNQRLLASPEPVPMTLNFFASQAGLFCDACEKIDHLENFLATARDSNQAIFEYVLTAAQSQDLDLAHLAEQRRQQLRARNFFISGG